jgi:hypothetical protein
MKPFKLFAIFLLLSVVSAWAQDENGGIKTSTDLSVQISSLPEAKLSLSQSFVFPVLQGSSPLTSGNNIAAVLSAEVSPVSLNGKAEITWTPVAFFLLSGGGLAGSGWNMALGNGIGINRPEHESDPLPRKAEIDGTAFDGLLWRAWGAGTVQFDLGAVIPGDWNHILFQSRQELRYAEYSRAGPDDAWVFEADSGENQNGLVYYASYVLGYQMPLSPVLDTVAFMAEQEIPLYTGQEYWGGNLGKWTFSGLFNFSITPSFSTALVVQMQTRRNHGSSNFNNKEFYYRDFEIKDEGGQLRLLFYRAALLFSYKIR